MFSLNILRVVSVKTQLILLSVINVATCFDTWSHHQVNFLNYIKGKSCKSTHFWDPKMLGNILGSQKCVFLFDVHNILGSQKCVLLLDLPNILGILENILG